MKMVDEMPTEGQFVAVWEYNGELWSAVHKKENDTLYIFDQNEDDFVKDDDLQFFEEVNPVYFIKGKQ